MVRWEPISGVLPPISANQWQQEFDHYREYPEYQKINKGMSLEAFKTIFYFEWAHRVLGRTIGLVFALGFFWLWYKRYLTRRMDLHFLQVQTVCRVVHTFSEGNPKFMISVSEAA